MPVTRSRTRRMGVANHAALDPYGTAEYAPGLGVGGRNHLRRRPVQLPGGLTHAAPEILDLVTQQAGPAAAAQLAAANIALQVQARAERYRHSVVHADPPLANKKSNVEQFLVAILKAPAGVSALVLHLEIRGWANVMPPQLVPLRQFDPEWPRRPDPRNRNQSDGLLFVDRSVILLPALEANGVFDSISPDTMTEAERKLWWIRHAEPAVDMGWKTPFILLPMYVTNPVNLTFITSRVKREDLHETQMIAQAFRRIYDNQPPTPDLARRLRTLYYYDRHTPVLVYEDPLDPQNPLEPNIPNPAWTRDQLDAQHRVTIWDVEDALHKISGPQITELHLSRLRGIANSNRVAGPPPGTNPNPGLRTLALDRTPLTGWQFLSSLLSWFPSLQNLSIQEGRLRPARPSSFYVNDGWPEEPPFIPSEGLKLSQLEIRRALMSHRNRLQFLALTLAWPVYHAGDTASVYLDAQHVRLNTDEPLDLTFPGIPSPRVEELAEMSIERIQYEGEDRRFLEDFQSLRIVKLGAPCMEADAFVMHFNEPPPALHLQHIRNHRAIPSRLFVLNPRSLPRSIHTFILDGFGWVLEEEYEYQRTMLSSDEVPPRHPHQLHVHHILQDWLLRFVNAAHHGDLRLYPDLRRIAVRMRNAPRDPVPQIGAATLLPEIADRCATLRIQLVISTEAGDGDRSVEEQATMRMLRMNRFFDRGLSTHEEFFRSCDGDARGHDAVVDPVIDGRDD